MGCGGINSCRTTADKKIEINNNKLIETTFNNQDQIDLNGKLLELFSDFSSFCNNSFPNLENLKLGNNNLSDISELKNLKAPKLKILDLSNNKIENLDVFKEVDFVLDELYLKGNSINQIGIFVDAKSLQKLKKLRISMIDNERNKNLITNLKQTIKDLNMIQIK